MLILSKEIQSQRYVILMDFAHDACYTSASFPKKQLRAELMRNSSKLRGSTVNLHRASLIVISHWFISPDIQMSGGMIWDPNTSSPDICMSESRVSDHQSYSQPLEKAWGPSQPFSGKAASMGDQHWFSGIVLHPKIFSAQEGTCISGGI